MSKTMRQIEILLLILIVLCSITGIVGFINTFTGQTSLSWSYGIYSGGSGILTWLIKYGRDIIVTLLFFKLILVKKSGDSYITIFFILAIFYSIFVSFANSLDKLYYVCGYREFIYAVVAIFIYVTRNKNNMFVDGISKLIPFIVIVQALAQLWLIIRSGIELGTTRLPGLCNGAISLGYFSIGVTIVLSVLFNYFKKYKMWQYILMMSGCFFLSVTTGTRVAMICNSIVILTTLLINIKVSTNLKNIFIFLGFITVPVIFEKIIAFAGRGDLMASGNGRIDFFYSYLKNADLFQILFGCGLGTLTNNAFNLKLKLDILKHIVASDSTWALMIGQFGVFGLTVWIIIIVYVLKRVLEGSKNIFDFVFRISIIAIGFITMTGTNIFEQSLFSLLYIWSVCVVLYKNEEMGERRKYAAK